MNKASLYKEIECIAEKIENNTAVLADYQRYELLLQNAGLTKEYIYSYLNKAGLNNWNQLVQARRAKQLKNEIGANLIGGIVGIGLGILLANLFKDNLKG